jgi:D-alanyl-D-alanine carboxypeptidase (penicillin-binding protein 5/6)
MQSLGLDNTQLHSKVYRRDTSIAPERSQQFGIGSTTTDEMVTLLTRLYRGELADEHNTDAMLKHLLACNDQTKLARELPTNTELFHKTGAIGNCRTDAGIILTATGPVAVCVLTNKNVDQRWTNDNEAELLCSAIGRVIIDRFGKEPDSTGLRRGASGVMVENLQRTLNHRMKLDPGLSVDGDFGPATETAVKQFQVSQGIAPSGILDTATWKALETLVEEESITEDPVQFNARVAKLPKQVPPALTDPPIVTCKSWLIADGITGAELWSYKAHERRPPASTTKMMTAHIVLQLMAEKPEIGNEVVMISSKADQTIGSSSGLRAGEQVTVMELLYGLLLPSGNDAATAIAEHFGERLKTKLSSAAASPTEAFVSYMNQTAHSLGMDSTQFRNPHGLNDPDHWTTAKDLVRLAHVAMQNPSFQQIVSTRQHACAVESQEGYRRVVVWRNTNQLLELEGFSGVKTGTTEAAGACLVSTGVQDGKSRIIVILGSSDSQTRYADTRNLFRWSLTANN